MTTIAHSNRIFSERISHFFDKKLSEKLFKDESTYARMNDVISRLNLKSNALCLDIGTGTGANLLLPALKTTQHYGCDISAEMLAKAQAKQLDSHFFVCDLDNLPLPTQSLDFIMGTEVLHHIHDYEVLLLKLYELLAPGGHIYIGYEWYQDSLFIPINYTIFNTKLFFAKISNLFGNPKPLDHLYHFRRADYHYLKPGEKKGFDPERLEKVFDHLPDARVEVSTHFHSMDSADTKFSGFWKTIRFFDNLFQTLTGKARRGHWVQILVTKN